MSQQPNSGTINNFNNDGNRADKQIQGVSGGHITMEKNGVQYRGNTQIGGGGNNPQFQGVMTADGGGKINMGYDIGGGGIGQQGKESKRQNQQPHHTSGGEKKPRVGHNVGPKSGTTVNDMQEGHIVPNSGTINTFNNERNQADKQIQGVSGGHITMEENGVQFRGNTQTGGGGNNPQIQGVIKAHGGGYINMGSVSGGGKIEQQGKESAEEVQEEQQDVPIQGEQQRHMDRLDHLIAQVQHLTARIDTVSGQLTAGFAQVNATLANILARLDSRHQ